MNRDERLTRVPALPPQMFRSGDLLAVYPHEPEGGTWIASNERGITLALLNWNLRGGQSVMDNRSSRGSIIPHLITQHDVVDVTQKLNTLSLQGILPFRLVGIFWRERELYEWRWNGAALTRVSFPWRPGHWFSSGISDAMAGRARREHSRLAWQDANAGTLPWLRELHRSHGPRPGAFGICVHRNDAATISYSEVIYAPGTLTFNYSAGQPCKNHPLLTLDIPLVQPGVVA